MAERPADAGRSLAAILERIPRPDACLELVEGARIGSPEAEQRYELALARGDGERPFKAPRRPAEPATVEEIEKAYIDAWRIGAKAVSIYRDGSKRMQPLNTSKDAKKAVPEAQAAPAPAQPVRRKLPDLVLELKAHPRCRLLPDAGNGGKFTHILGLNGSNEFDERQPR